MAKIAHRPERHTDGLSDEALIARIRALEDIDPPPGLSERIIIRVKRQPASSWKRIWQRLWQPLTVTIRPLPWAAVAMLLVLGMTAFRLFPDFPSPSPIEPAGLSQGVTFSLLAPEARSVQLIGSFNQWRPGLHALSVDPGAGQWIIRLHLAPGRHEYAFLVDGERVVSDPRAPFSQTDGFGTRNSVIFTDGHDARRL